MSICILIVDDDRLVVEKLAKGIGWERIGIESVLTANNVRQAMKILEEAPVDILLSDIEMPQGSGLELLEWVRGRDLPVECVFLSSYAYFAYAQKAINLKSSNYLLKPVSNSEMEEVLAALVKDIRGRRQVLEKEDRKEKRHLFWKTYLLQETWNGAWLERARQEGIYKPERRVCLHLLRIFPGVEQKTRDVTLNHFIVRNVTEEFFEREESAGRLEAVVRRCDSEWFLIFEAGGMGEAVSAYRQCLERTLSMRICIYIGRDCPEAELHERRKYLEWIEQEAVPGDDGLVRESEWVKKDVKALTAPWKEWEQEMVDGYAAAIEAAIEGLIPVPSVSEITYKIIEGANQTVIKGKGSSVTIKSDGDFDKFVKVSIDNAEVAKEHYTAEAGSTVITLKAAYVETLAAGNHTVRIDHTDGFAQTVLTVQDEEEEKKPGGSGGQPSDQPDDGSKDDPSKASPAKRTSPKTGDGMPVIWLCAMVISFVIVRTLRRSGQGK